MPKIPQNTSYEAIYKAEHAPKQLVVMSNELAQATLYSLSTMEEKLLMALISRVRPHQKELAVRFSTRQFMHMTALSHSGTNFDDILHDLKNIADKSCYVRDKNGKYHLKRWIKDVEGDPKYKGKPASQSRGEFRVIFRNDMKGLIFFLKHKYNTIYPISDVLLMKSNYSIKLYDFFKSNASIQPNRRLGLDYSLKEIKLRLNLVKHRSNGKIWRNKYHQVVYKYPRFADFKRRVLRPAVNEINKYTECNIHIRKIKRGRKVVGINVMLRRKSDAQQRKRDTQYYLTVKGIPKSKWGAYRRKMIYGTTDTKEQMREKEIFKIKHYGEHKTIEGQYKVVPYPFQIKKPKTTNLIVDFFNPFDKKFEKMEWPKMRKLYESYRHLKAVKKEVKKINNNVKK